MNLNDYKAMSGAARKSALVTLTNSGGFGKLTDEERDTLTAIAELAGESKSEVIASLAAKLKGMVDDAGRIHPATQPEEPKKDAPVTTVDDHSKLEVAIATEVPAPTAPLTVSGKADLGCNFRDRHPECFAKAN